MDRPGEARRNHLRLVIEQRAGRSLAEIIRELHRDRGQTPIQISCACTELAGENVAIAMVEDWLYEFGLADRSEHWTVMAPRLKALLDGLIQEEVDRRLKDG